MNRAERSSVSRRAPFRLLGLTAAGCLALVAVGGATATAATAATQGGLIQIRGNVLPSLDLLPSMAAPAEAQLSVGVGLAHPDPAGERGYLAALYQPGSPVFHRFLDSAAYDARFGVPKERTEDVVSRLRAAGLQVGLVASAGDYVAATGSVAQVERAFGVVERSYTSKGHTFLANTAGPLVPVDDQVLSVVGLNTLQRYRPAQGTCTNGVCTGNTTPQDLWSVYQQPAAYEGKGASIAIIGEGKTQATIANLRADEAAYGLPQPTVRVNCTQGAVNGDCGIDSSGDGEWQIDTQASLGMAPQADSETLYFANSILDGDLNNSFVAWAQDPAGPLIASASLGECESSPANGVFTGPLGPTNGNTSGGPAAVVAFGNGEQSVVDPVLAKAVLAGKTLFASTGDTGSSCPLVYLPVIGAGNGVANQGLPEQNYPAVSVSAVAVGGTVLYTTANGEGSGSTYKPGQPPATRALEYAWPFGGGGASLYTPEPSWQQAVPQINQPCVIGADGSTGATGTTCRGVPDVAAQSGDVLTNGYSVATAGTPTTFGSGGGTSLSSPLWAGMWARVVGAASSPLGFAAPLLYRSGTHTDAAARDYTDVTLGSNGLRTAGPGWDYTTGFGTAQVDGLICDLAGKPSGRYAAGVPGACPLTVIATTATMPATMTPAATPPRASTPAVKKPVTKKVAKRPAAHPVAAVQPTRTLAFTGLGLALPIGGLALLTGSLALGRRRRHFGT